MGQSVYKCGTGWGRVVYNVLVVGDSGILLNKKYIETGGMVATGNYQDYVNR